MILKMLVFVTEDQDSPRGCAEEQGGMEIIQKPAASPSLTAQSQHGVQTEKGKPSSHSKNNLFLRTISLIDKDNCIAKMFSLLLIS